MKRILAVALALLMLVAVVPSTASAASTIDYSIYDVGPELRAQSPSKANIDFSSGDMYSGGGSGSAQLADYDVGDWAWWLGLDDYNGYYEFKNYTLMAAGNDAEIWVSHELAFPMGDTRPCDVTQDQVDYLLAEMEENILPTMTQFYRAPDAHDGRDALLVSWGYYEPGYFDGDKVVVLVDNIKDENYYDPTYPSYIAGFYSPSFEAYFDRNIISIDCYDWDNRIGDNVAKPNVYEGVIAHEYQHLLHDDVDGDEDTFLNEGLSEFSEFVCGYGVPQSHVDAIKAHPENSLPAWGDQGDLEILADYGMVFMWTYYLYEKFGTSFIKSMFNDQMNGIESIENVLQKRSKWLHFENVYNDFSLAMLMDSSMLKFKYGFKTLNFKIDVGTLRKPNTEAFSSEGAPAWGSDYVWLNTANKKATMFMFDGADSISKPTPWTSVSGALWSGDGDERDNWAIFEATGGGTLTFDTKYDIEDYWDFGIVQVSTDGGKTWTSLANAYTTSTHDADAMTKIVDNLPGLTGISGGGQTPQWITMSFDLSAYSGNILIGFRYMTD